MTTQLEERNKAPVLEAFDTLFNKRDYDAAARFWSPNTAGMLVLPALQRLALDSRRRPWTVSSPLKASTPVRIR